MFSGRGNLSYENFSNRIVWMSLAFQAGAINVGGYLACHRFVTHTTGFATLFGVEMAKKQATQALGMLSVPAFFLLGAMLSSFFVDRRILQGRRPYYSHVFFLMTFFLIAIFLLGISNQFGHFGNEVVLDHDFGLLATLCLTSGLQNAIVTTAFGSIIRTTHLTGLTTDLGIGLVRIFSRSQKPEPRTNEIKATWMRVSIILSFILGSTIAAEIFLSAQYWGFAIPATISLLLWFYSLWQNRQAPYDGPFNKFFVKRAHP